MGKSRLPDHSVLYGSTEVLVDDAEYRFIVTQSLFAKIYHRIFLRAARADYLRVEVYAGSKSLYLEDENIVYKEAFGWGNVRPYINNAAIGKFPHSGMKMNRGRMIYFRNYERKIPPPTRELIAGIVSMPSRSMDGVAQSAMRAIWRGK